MSLLQLKMLSPTKEAGSVGVRSSLLVLQCTWQSLHLALPAPPRPPSLSSPAFTQPSSCSKDEVPLNAGMVNALITAANATSSLSGQVCLQRPWPMSTSRLFIYNTGLVALPQQEVLAPTEDKTEQRKKTEESEDDIGFCLLIKSLV